MDTISFKRDGKGKYVFSTARFDYSLVYRPDTVVRGAYSYDLFRENGDWIASFATLQEARVWVTSIGFNALDVAELTIPDDASELEVTPETVI